MKTRITLLLLLALSGCAAPAAPERYRLFPVKDEADTEYRSINEHSRAWLLDTQTGAVQWCSAFSFNANTNAECH